MKTHTYTLQLETSKEVTFEFVSRVENLPKWAPLFCHGVRPYSDDVSLIRTVAGELFFRIAAEAVSGVTDMYGGPALDRLAYWPARVVERPGGKSLFMITIFQFPGMSEREFDAQCRTMANDLLNLKQRLDERPVTPSRAASH